MTDKPKYACPHCGEIEYVTRLNTYDIYVAKDDGLRFQSQELCDNEFQLHCRQCSEPAPAEFQNAAH